MNELKIYCGSMPKVIEADYGFVQKPYAHCDRVAPFNVLIYLIKGEMEIIEDGTPYTLTPNTVFLLRNGLHHWGEKTFSIGTAWYYVHFYAEESDFPPMETGKKREDRLCITEEEYERSVEIPKIIHLSSDSIRESFSALCDYHNSRNHLKASLALWDILISLNKSAGSPGTGLSRRTKALMSYIEQNFARNITPHEIEENSGLSYKYAGSLFKEETGFTIHSYQLTLRIESAKKALRESRKTVSEIAAENGFYDAFYFSRIFKRETGISPAKYRSSYEPKI